MQPAISIPLILMQTADLFLQSLLKREQTVPGDSVHSGPEQQTVITVRTEQPGTHTVKKKTTKKTAQCG